MAAWGEETRQGIITGQEGTQRQRVSITLVMVMATQVTIPHTYQIAPLNLSSYITPTPMTLPLLPVVNPTLLANALGRDSSPDPGRLYWNSTHFSKRWRQ